MLCDICKKNEAAIYYTEIINGEKKEQHLCEKCAAEHTSFQIINPAANQEFSLGGLLSSILKSYSSMSDTEKKPDIVCKNCGLSYDEFLEKGKFGCASCYHSFGRMLEKSLKGLQGSDVHVGKKPKGYISEADRIISGMTEVDKLSILLQQAIEQEEFEEAAKIRDHIRSLKNAGEQESTSAPAGEEAPYA